MKESNKQKDHFKADAKQITDTLFDASLFRDDLSRDDMNAIEGYISTCMSLRYETYLRNHELMQKLKGKKETTL